MLEATRVDGRKRLPYSRFMACKLNENGKQMRGFAVIGLAARKRIAAMGGRKTAKKLGRAHMSRIGRNGRRKRGVSFVFVTMKRL